LASNKKDGFLIIDGLNVSNWESENVYRDLNKGNVNAINATTATWENYSQTLDNIAVWYSKFNNRTDISLVRKVDDIFKASDNGQVGIIIGFQNASPIENNLDYLYTFDELNVKIIQFTYHERNLLGNGCYERVDEGITNFGIDAIKIMNEVGILIDLSHVGIVTTMETIDYSEKPIAITHANPKSYHNVPRNKTDEALKLMASKGGIVGVTAIAPFLKKGNASTVEDYVEAISYTVDLVGIDHVGVGTDFTQDQPEEFWRYIGSQQGTKFPSTFTDVTTPSNYPINFETPDKFPVLIDTMENKGFSSEEIAKILGLNWIRVFQEVWE
tara:strand:- start:438 stop:1421 length:984 start_codon:yes stop_codon:yes gene_type:complete